MRSRYLLYYTVGIILFYYFDSISVNGSKCGRHKHKRTTALPPVKEPNNPERSGKAAEEYEYYDINDQNLTLNIKLYFDVPRTLLMGTNIKFSLNYYAKTVIKGAEKYFRHPAWTFPININLMDVRYIQSLTNMKLHTADSRDILRDFCMWRRINRDLFSDTWIFNILMTELDLKFVDSFEVNQESAGASMQRGYCDGHWNCAIIEYNKDSFLSSVMISHELGHSLGAIHDEDTDCMSEYSIMTARLKSNLPKQWSNCSRYMIEDYLLNQKSSCLGDDTFRAVLAEHNENATINHIYNVNLTRIEEIFR